MFVKYGKRIKQRIKYLYNARKNLPVTRESPCAAASLVQDGMKILEVSRCLKKADCRYRLLSTDVYQLIARLIGNTDSYLLMLKLL